ncbi:hypothetical protein AGMMS49938_00960 [Fibrobacterales bacterium]|nr:hypothetical protein AGMMS49938_00960 [Fibrobacterales bacterium]
MLAQYFPIYFFDCDIYCERCRAVQKFKIFSQVEYDKHDLNKILPAKPLYCKCDKCENFTIYTTDEFAELQEQDYAKNSLCKIWGLSNLETGDRVWHSEYGIGRVENIFNNKGNTSYSLSFLSLENQTIPPQSFNDDKLTSIFYRIIPQNIANAKIGENAYHTEQKCEGKIVGLSFGEKNNIIAKFGNEILTIENTEENFLSNEAIEKNAKWRCENLPFFEDLEINTISQILSVQGKVPNLKAACNLETIINSVPHIRSSILLLDIQESTDENKVISDDLLTSSSEPTKIIITKNNLELYKLLIKNEIHIYNCKIQFAPQEIFITGFYCDKSIPERIYTVLGNLPIKSLKLDLKFRSEIKILKTSLKNGNFVRIVSSGETILIDGWVKTSKQKSFATIEAILRSLKFNVKNNLYITLNNVL